MDILSVAAETFGQLWVCVAATPPPPCTTLMWQLATTWCLNRCTIFGHCWLFDNELRFCHRCRARGGGVMGHPKFFYELHFCEKVKNEAKTGLRGEQGGDEVSCKHACKCDAVAMQSLVSEIALLF